MVKIISAAIAVPPYRVTQRQAREFAAVHFSSKIKNIEKLLPVFDNARIESRNFCVPPGWFLSEKSFSQKNQVYIEWACKLGGQAAEDCLESADISPGEVDSIIFVSTTGLATPSIDARLVNSLKMRHDIRRTPVWGLGCVGGAVGLSLATDYIRAYPDSKVLLVAVELCGLTFLFNDYSLSNLIAVALFGDGAAAVLLSGEGTGLQIVDRQSTIWPDSLDVMGWNFSDEGLQVVFSKSIPSIVNRYAYDSLACFISKHKLTLSDIGFYLIHPGGAKVIDAYRNSLGLTSDELRLGEEILRDYGNMSSVTVLYMLDRMLRTCKISGLQHGLLTALGPGFSSESLLLRSCC